MFVVAKLPIAQKQEEIKILPKQKLFKLLSNISNRSHASHRPRKHDDSFGGGLLDTHDIDKAHGLGKKHSQNGDMNSITNGEHSVLPYQK